jgi:hypothetical protein
VDWSASSSELSLAATDNFILCAVWHSAQRLMSS